MSNQALRASYHIQTVTLEFEIDSNESSSSFQEQKVFIFRDCYHVQTTALKVWNI